MSTSSRSNNCARAFIATLIFAGFFWTLVLGGSPQLHRRIHTDASRSDHTCAVTLIASGSYDHPVQPPIVSAPNFALQFSEIPALTPQWVKSPFLGASIFEHAPPARG
jgi:hypothetical protein